MKLTAVFTPAPEGGYIAFNPETGTTTQGETIEDAMENLRDATQLYLSECPEFFSEKRETAYVTLFEVSTVA